MRSEVESDRKSTRLNSSHSQISYAVFCLKKKKNRASGPPTPTPPTYCPCLAHCLSSSLTSRTHLAAPLPTRPPHALLACPYHSSPPTTQTRRYRSAMHDYQGRTMTAGSLASRRSREK